MEMDWKILMRRGFLAEIRRLAIKVEITAGHFGSPRKKLG
jgi:hypothetical protein